jgi:hypothetical protein
MDMVQGVFDGLVQPLIAFRLRAIAPRAMLSVQRALRSMLITLRSLYLIRLWGSNFGFAATPVYAASNSGLAHSSPQ